MDRLESNFGLTSTLIKSSILFTPVFSINFENVDLNFLCRSILLSRDPLSLRRPPGSRSVGIPNLSCAEASFLTNITSKKRVKIISKFSKDMSFCSAKIRLNVHWIFRIQSIKLWMNIATQIAYRRESMLTVWPLVTRAKWAHGHPVPILLLWWRKFLRETLPEWRVFRVSWNLLKSEYM